MADLDAGLDEALEADEMELVDRDARPGPGMVMDHVDDLVSEPVRLFRPTGASEEVPGPDGGSNLGDERIVGGQELSVA
ncbi:MAG: hypothetical protein HKN24_04780 [Acidimicrobiales bacterium]|nr:hypothetical protein [Acidimicrobiales bacterium]